MPFCSFCKNSLSPDMTLCPRCGQPTTPFPIQGNGDLSHTVASSYPSTPGNSFSISDPLAYQQTQLPPHSLPMSPHLSTSQNSAQGQFLPSALPSLSPVGSFPLQDSEQRVPDKTRRGRLLILVVLAFFVMSGGIGLIYYSTIVRPAQLQAQATATVEAIQTTSAQSTATINTQITATVQAQTRARATAATQATAQVQSTAVALQNLYTRSTSSQPALNVTLSAQNSANWDIYDAVGGGGCTFTGGALHANVQQKNFYVPCFAQNTNFKNFLFQVEMTILSGDEGGILFRADDTSSKFYYFRISQDGIYSLSISKDEKHSTSLIYDNSTVIKTGTGQKNLLTVLARENTIYLYINKQFVASTSDTTYTGGKIGVFASDLGHNTDVAFTNAQVWIL